MFRRLPSGSITLRYRPSIQFWRPQLVVMVKGPSNVFEAHALLDTGADRCCFPADVAGYIGIDLAGIPRFILGTVGDPVTAWEHEVSLTFPELRNFSTNARVWFVDNPALNPLIGREPLLSEIQVGFRQSRYTFYVLTTP